LLTRDQVTEQEMARGRAIGARAEKRALLDRYESTNGVVVKLDHDGSQIVSRSWVVNGMIVATVEYKDLWTEDYPSDALLLTLSLAINATVGMDSVPVPRPTHKVSDSGKDYNTRLRAANKGRPDIK
jgi:hypothetical protein